MGLTAGKGEQMLVPIRSPEGIEVATIERPDITADWQPGAVPYARQETPIYELDRNRQGGCVRPHIRKTRKRSS